MISEKMGFIFLHVPKTGGNAVQTLLERFSDDRKRLEAYQDGVDRFDITGRVTPHKHATLEEYAQRVDVTRFAVALTCRHPVDRMISFYFSPHRWLESVGDGWIPREPVWDRAFFLSILPRLKPAVSYLDVAGERRRPDHVLRFERLQQDLDAFLRAVGIEAVPPLPRVNQGKAAPGEVARARADGVIAEIARKNFRDDFEYFGYPLP